ncbi:MAG TPA: DUF2007 domain-containing protein [Bacteroidales bacterium]|nr:DUF2007 domain-containing protein [Bacteroidales bacterium]HSA42891.1 DUF2007 domain-containing protein [Bacteroidales bacterium]
MTDSAEHNWVMIYSSPSLVEVEIRHGLLRSEDIESIIINKKDSFYLIGDIELYVKSGDAFSARQIISDSDSE